MTNSNKPNELGTCVLLMMLNNRLYENGIITETQKNKISAEIQIEHKKNQTA